MKKIVFNILVFVAIMFLLVGCNNNSIEKENEKIASETSDVLKELNVEYVGGLYARSETNDMMLALFKSNGVPIVVITEYGNLYYGEYTTEDKTLPDGTKYEAITVEDKTYGYYFNEDLTGILVDREGNKYEAKKLDISVATDMVKQTIGE